MRDPRVVHGGGAGQRGGAPFPAFGPSRELPHGSTSSARGSAHQSLREIPPDGGNASFWGGGRRVSSRPVWARVRWAGSCRAGNQLSTWRSCIQRAPSLALPCWSRQPLNTPSRSGAERIRWTIDRGTIAAVASGPLVIVDHVPLHRRSPSAAALARLLRYD